VKKRIDVVRIEARSSHVTPYSRKVPDLQDTRIVGITSDGEEIEITSVSEVRWIAKNDMEPARVELVILGAEINAVGELESPIEVEAVTKSGKTVVNYSRRKGGE
jgi:hypothetical protein